MKRWQGAALGMAGLMLGALGMRLVAPLAGPDDHPPAKAEAADAGPGLHVDDKVQQQAGVQIAPLVARHAAVMQDGFARGLDPAPLGTIASDITAATAAHDGSSRELARLTALVAADAGASRRDLDAARAQEGQDRAKLTQACHRVGLEFGPALGKLGCAAVARLAAEATAGRLAVLRIDFPDGAVPAGSSVTIDLGKAEATVRVLGPAVAGDTQLQSAGVLALLEGPEAALAGVGRVLSAHRAGGGARDGMIVPRSAIVRADGALQVWRATGPENFERVPIDGATPVVDGWFVARGGALKPGDRLVVAGAGTLLGLERSAGGGGGGD